MYPFVSIIIPCRNEEKHIGKCLDSIIEQDFPKENLEVLVVDGDSTDRTREIVEKLKIKNERLKIKLLANPKKYTPFGLNIGIKEAKGDVVIRMDAHAGYEKDYISKCVKVLQESGADNVGGAIKTLPAADTMAARAIAYVLSGPLGAVSVFRLGSAKTMEVDTVFGGCYKKEIFEKIGLFDERMLRSQDIEFNKRLKKAGGKIILSPEIISVYYPQTTLFSFLKHNFQDGVWVTYPLKFGVRYFSLRHLIPLFFVSILMGLGFFSFFSKTIFFLFLLDTVFYFAANKFISWRISRREKEPLLFPFLVIASVSRHFGYGLGSLWGLVKTLKG